eukprot:TRINITY_DN3700_c0_g1_i1.p1 TRINITY_DN3700_c0_g1~~TRINITY_DN3700_c0_g1_i1.p1  ORF type:complete len:249 (+),score=26.24 TRINITY_DN3700_c0_g1_i1:62-808(+)
MVITSYLNEQQPPGGSSFGGHYHKDAFAGYIYPKDGNRRTERREHRTLTHAAPAGFATALDNALVKEQTRPSRFRSAVDTYLHKMATAPPTAAERAFTRSASTPELGIGNQAAATDFGKFGRAFAEAARDEGYTSRQASARSEDGTQTNANMQSLTRYCPHPIGHRGVLKVCGPRAIENGQDPDAPPNTCPFWEGENHRFAAVLAKPSARPRTPTRSLRWRDNDAANNPKCQTAYKVTHIVPRRSMDH